MKFKITGIDSLGQGVSKDSDKITFIPKTAVGDEGEAEIVAQKKGVIFAKATSFTTQSSQRITPACPHFESCPSCHLQHVSYETELQVKKDAFERLFRKIAMPSTTVIGAPERIGYRNRVQLHYDRKTRKLGMLDVSKHQIVSIPQCMIGQSEIGDEIRRLYSGDQWLSHAPSEPKGHVELYSRASGVHMTWNKPYASGGFTQVNKVMNQKLIEELLKWNAEDRPETLLDLFAGNGNLSNSMKFTQRKGFDMYEKTPGPDFKSLDLYSKNALKAVLKDCPLPDAILLDPPRSGMKDLKEWLKALNPKRVAYVSCDPHTLARDVSGLDDYSVTHAFVLDFFPSTYHFESLLFLERKC